MVAAEVIVSSLPLNEAEITLTVIVLVDVVNFECINGVFSPIGANTKASCYHSESTILNNLPRKSQKPSSELLELRRATLPC